MAVGDYRIGTGWHGFTITAVTELSDLDATLVQLRHEKTGARWVHVERPDDENLFGVGFRTPPKDSTGVAHILEHTVLCGSRRFPVRDPFFTMLKRSLSSFMNALTASDWTFYPFSTQNTKDFYNLMQVYLDAVFFPLLRERDFRQEGHRLEFADPGDSASPLVFKGVVYNEMKGAMADASSLLHRHLTRGLYPTTTYGFNSGGEPEQILQLTYEQLRQFHAAFYHPANAYIFTYGDLPLVDHLAAVERLALSQFGPLQVDSSVPDEQRLPAPQRLEATFAADADEADGQRCLVQVGWLACPLSDSFERLAMSLLSELLLGNPAAPLYQALLDSGLGQNLAPGSGYADENRETYFAVGLQGTAADAWDKVESLILETLATVAEQGFSEEQVEAALHQLEFGFREVSGDQYPYSLNLLMRLVGPWLHADDPVSPLQVASDMQRLRRELSSGPFLQNLIRRRLLDNPHRVSLLLRPDAEQGAREEAQAAARLETLRRQLTPADVDRLVRQGLELQQAQEGAEDVSCLPGLELTDIPVVERRVDSRPAELGQVPVTWFDQPTNGIGYFSAALPVADLPEWAISDLPLFCALFSKIGAAGQSYLTLAERMAGAVGGLRAAATVLDDPFDLKQYQVLVELQSKALIPNQDRMFGILTDLCTSPDFSDLKRLHTVIQQVKVSLENSVPGSGHSYAARVAAAALTPAARLRETWNGLHLIGRVKQLAAGTVQDLAPLAARLQDLASLIFRRDRLRCCVVAEERYLTEIEGHLNGFLEALPAGGPATAAPRLPQAGGSRCSGWIAPVPVSYVARVFCTVPMSHPDAAGLMVLARLLRGGYLHREIREKGGAYGGMASYDATAGLLSLLSYRDPHLVRTLKVYRDAVHWAASGDFDSQQIQEAVLGVFSALDRPLSPAGKGAREFHYQLQRLTDEVRQEFRRRLLAVDAASLAALAQRYLADGWQASAVAVVSGEPQLQEANRLLSQETLTLGRI